MTTQTMWERRILAAGIAAYAAAAAVMLTCHCVALSEFARNCGIAVCAATCVVALAIIGRTMWHAPHER
jgi:hypothetical protein